MAGREAFGTLLRVDLDRGQTTAERLPDALLRQYLGGRGIGIRLLVDHVRPGADPLGPENPLIFATGPYTGEGVFSAFFNVTTKSPLTGIAASSHCGGRWGPAVQRAGVDVLLFQGTAPEPCYLVVDGGRSTLKPAGHLWGQGVFETGRLLREVEGGGEVVCIGPAGENRVRIAAIMNEHRAAGRGGVGAVMGAKNLKAVVVKGDLRRPIRDPGRVQALSRQGGKQAGEVGAAFGRYGSSMALGFFNEKHTLPTHNFRGGKFDGVARIGAEALKEAYFVKDRGCFRCPLRCGNVHRNLEGEYPVDEIEGPEYETLMAFGSNCGNDDLASILKANWLCNDLGMDTISCGNTLALAMDLVEEGVLTSKDLDGHDLRWGRHREMLALIPLIANRTGVGDLLAEGSCRAASHWGPAATERVVHAKGQEYPGYESRRSFGTGFSLVTSNRGADHLRATLYVNELFAGEFAEGGFEAHLPTLLDQEHYLAVIDSLLVCKFGARQAGMTWPVLAELLVALSGEAADVAGLQRAGERIWNLERLFNLGEGVGEDLPPPRFFQEDLVDGQPGGQRISQERFIASRDKYYAQRGWNGEGRPSLGTLLRLDLGSDATRVTPGGRSTPP